MIADDPVIAQLAEANPVSPEATPGADDRAQADRILARVLSAPSPTKRWPTPPRRRGILVPVIGVVVALAVVAAIIRTGETSHGGAPASGQGQTRLVLRALSTPQVPVVTPAAMIREARILRARMRLLGVSSSTVTRAGTDRLVVVVNGVGPGARPRLARLLLQSPQLYFYDWEANALTPNGRTVASQLPAQDPTAMRISQGSAAGPGVPGGGGLGLYQAVKLASSRPVVALAPTQSRKGPQYYLFGAPGSAACAAAAKAFGTTVVAGRHCVLTRAPASSVAELDADLPSGVSASAGQLLAVPQGTVVLQAANVSASDQVAPYSPDAQFYVLRDHVSLTSIDITNPQEGTDQGGSPDVKFGFTGKGQARFQAVTATIAHRGRNVSLGGQILEQHFAVALDNQLVTVPQIDFRQYPDGVIGVRGDITAGLTRGSARALAQELRLGAPPLDLKVQPPG